MEEVTESLNEAAVSSTSDAKSGYWQVEIDKNVCDKSSFHITSQILRIYLNAILVAERISQFAMNNGRHIVTKPSKTQAKPSNIKSIDISLKKRLIRTRDTPKTSENSFTHYGRYVQTTSAHKLHGTPSVPWTV